MLNGHLFWNANIYIYIWNAKGKIYIQSDKINSIKISISTNVGEQKSPTCLKKFRNREDLSKFAPLGISLWLYP